LFAPLLNVLGIDSSGVRFALVSESSKAYPPNAPVDIVGLLGCSAPLVNSLGEQEPRIFRTVARVTMRIACLQFAPQVGDVDNNLNRAVGSDSGIFWQDWD
jgi:hypothetical protein